jgi:hypothetical protein
MNVDTSSTCRNCPFWSFLQTRDGSSPDDDKLDQMIGQCRLSPPTLHIIPVPKRTAANMQEVLKGGKVQEQIEMSMSVQPLSPQTSGDYWCGEHPGRYYDDAEEFRNAKGLN